MRVLNFSAGPGALPAAVLEIVQQEMLDYQGCGVSVMEMSHRGKEFMAIAEKARQDLRQLLSVPDNYQVLFLQGGATQQFSMVPLNLGRNNQRFAFVNSGQWSAKAIKEAARFGTVDIVAECQSVDGVVAVPEVSSWQVNNNTAFLHFTPNETIDGIEIFDDPDFASVPVVADFSSTILSRSINVSRYGLIYAGAQKNLGPAGLTLVIIRDDLLGHAAERIPKLMNYQVHADAESMANTPPTFSWYVAGLVFRWLLEQGGLPVMEEINQRKARTLYQVIDSSGGFYRNSVHTRNRSRMNIPFTIPSAPELEPVFLRESGEAGLLALKGHRLAGGMRASIYNAMSESGVEALASFMTDFMGRYG